MEDFKAIKVRLENYEILTTLGTGIIKIAAFSP